MYEINDYLWGVDLTPRIRELLRFTEASEKMKIGIARRVVECAIAVVALVVLGSTSRPARADLLPVSDVYREISELIQDLIHHRVGEATANALSQTSIRGRYFRETTERLKSHFWGSLDSTLEDDLIELAVDFAYYTAKNPTQPKDAFWKCVRQPSRADDGCGFVDNQTLFQTYCGPANLSIECDVARTLQATLQQREEIARTEAVQLFSDLVVSANVVGTPDASVISRFRQSIRAWMTAPEALRAQMNQLVKDFDVPEADLLRRDIDCGAPMTPRSLLDRGPLLKCFDDPAWKSRWDSVEVAEITVRQKTYVWKVSELLLANVTNLDALLEQAAKRICTAQEAQEIGGALRDLKADLDKAEEELAAAQLKRNGLQIQYGELTARGGTTDDDRKALADTKRKLDTAVADESKAKSRRDAAESANTQRQTSLKDYFSQRGVECGGAKPRFVAAVALEVKVAGFSVALREQAASPNVAPELRSAIARALTASSITLDNVAAFRRRVADVICSGCKLADHVASARRAIGAADLLGSLSPTSRERMLGDVSNAVQLAAVLGADDSQTKILDTLTQVLRASQRGDHRQLAAFVLEQLWPTPKDDPSDEAMFRAFFKAFASYLMDARKGMASGQSTAVAFREAAKDVLIRLNKRGVPDAGNAAFYPISPALRFSWNQTYADGRRALASLDTVEGRWAPSKHIPYIGLGGSVFDLLAPFAELALRDQRRTYAEDTQWLVALNAFKPRAFVWVAAPEFSRYLTVDAGVSYLPASVRKLDESCQTDCKFEYSLGHKALDHVEMSVGASVLF